MSNIPSGERNFVRLSDARLQAVSSRNMYSEHGLEAWILSVFGQVCHLLMVVSYWRPGSAQLHAAWATLSQSLRAGIVRAVLPELRHFVSQGASFWTASMKASVTRTELLEFWPLTV